MKLKYKETIKEKLNIVCVHNITFLIASLDREGF
jgi:hypothetical protein